MPKIIINEFYRGGTLTTGNEFIELLLLKDLTATELNLFFVGDSTGSKTSKFSAYDFTNMGTIASTFKAGTIIAVGGTGAFAQDITYNPTGGDWNIALNAGGSFLPNANSGNTGDIAGNDVVWVDTASSGATISADGFAVDIGTTTTGAFTAAANVDFGASVDNTGYALNSDATGASSTANWATGIAIDSTTPGQANGGANTTYINNLRGSASATSLTLSITPNSFSEAAGASAATGTVTRAGSTTSPLTVTLLSSDTTEANVPTTVTILAGQTSANFAVDAVDDAIVDGSQNVTITASASGFSDGAASVTVTDNETAPTTGITKIHNIQGSGSTFNSSFGGSRTIEGIVVGDFQGSTGLSGFYVQEEDADADADSTTSEGIFVFDSTFGVAVNVGDKVRVTGTVGEFTSSGNNLTQLSSITNVTNLGASTLPTVTNIQLPVTSVTDLERYEGMRVNISAEEGNLTVTEFFELGRFGQILLSATGASNQPGTDGRLDQYTQFNAPSVSGYSAYLGEIAKRQIYLDDGRSTQNPDPIIFGRGGNPLSATNTLRGGDTVASIIGVLDQRFEGYRVQTTSGVNFTPTNPRPTAAPNVGGTLKVASFNVLNYFNGDGTGSGFPTARGADTSAEFTRQRAKTIAAINALNADVVGLIEMENDGYGATSAIQDLVNGLNAVTAPGTYAFVNPGVGQGSDAIKVAFIYKPGSVTPVGNAVVTPSGFGTGSFDLVGRKPLAQTFRQNSNNEQFTAVVNHFKSKGSSSGGAGDADAGDGQALSNGTRTRQAQDLAAWLATNPTGTTDTDYLILGDLNAYAKEDPLTTLASSGYNSLVPNRNYSYVFDGQWGSLDYALANSSLKTQVTGAAEFHINADEPSVLDYNTEFKSTGQQTSLYNSDFYRSSDHDPILVGLNLYTVNNNITGSGRTSITGTAGNDRITGNPGAKTLTGGGGSDQFVYNSIKDSGHTIADFTVGSDTIVLTGLLDSLVSGGYNGSDAITDGYVRIVAGSSANSSLIQIDRDGLNGAAIFRPFLQVDNISVAEMNNINNFVF
ncbi:hypothetical protein CAL7716_012340 [Calothrix sp. PCC 7716]|nr:hypothetical protein CAL7716_012340 [Calothrix sp. PCC 7716]